MYLNILNILKIFSYFFCTDGPLMVYIGQHFLMHSNVVLVLEMKNEISFSEGTLNMYSDQTKVETHKMVV